MEMIRMLVRAIGKGDHDASCPCVTGFSDDGTLSEADKSSICTGKEYGIVDGYPAWGGSKTSAATNVDIKSSLGLGIVRFEEKPEEPQIETYDYEYRVNTDVITAVRISGGQSDPDSPTRVSFNIGGQTYSVGNVYYPEGDSQLAWVKWRTPDTEQNMTVQVTVSGPAARRKRPST